MLKDQKFYKKKQLRKCIAEKTDIFAPTNNQVMTMNGIEKICYCKSMHAAKVVKDCLNENKSLCVRIKNWIQGKGDGAFFLILRADKQDLLVCQDTGIPYEELADEEQFNGDDPLYFNEITYRVSPVFELLRCKKLLEPLAKIQQRTILPVLLTGSRIINVEDMIEVWEKLGVIVHSEQRGRSPFTNRAIAAVDFSYLPLLTYQYAVACAEKLAIKDAFKDVDYQKEKKTYKVYESSKDKGKEEMVEPHLFDFDEDEQEEVMEEEQEERLKSYEEEIADFVLPKIPEDIDNAPNVELLPPMNDPYQVLDSMIGMQTIKRDINNILAMSKYNELLRRHNKDAQTHQLSLHTLFLGGPGTGKTTLARIYGSVLRKAGTLSKGHTVVCTRSSFLGTRWGDEEAKLKICLDLAKGGVLFIDEAYLLNSQNSQDPGKNVLQLMLPMLADEEQRDIAVVLAGYTKPMNELIALNQGLASRFANKFEFQDLTFQELLDVTRLYIRKYGYHFTASAWKEYSDRLKSCYDARTPDWGNARFVHLALDHLFQYHAMRCVKHEVSGDQLLALTIEDVRNTTYLTPKKDKQNLRIIGFK